MIASAASAPPSSESAATAGSSPGSSLCSGSRAPITPVERTSTSSASRSSSRAASAAVASASSLPRSPVAAFATPELITTACGSASARCSRLTCRHAAWTLLRVNIAAPTACGTERTIARSFRSLPPDPGRDARGDESLRGGDAHRRPRSYQHAPEPQPGRLRQPEREVQRSAPPARPRPCRGCRSRRSRSHIPVAPSVKTPISALSVPCTRAISGSIPSGSTRTTALPA